MLSLPLSCGFLVWVVFSFLVNGIAPFHRFTKFRGIDLIGYGLAVGVMLHGVVGWAIAAVPAGRWVFVVILLGLSLTSTIYCVRQRVLQELLLALSRAAKIALALWALLLLICLGILHLDVPYADPLSDGLYVSKEHTTNVRIQVLTGLPADNYIPFAVAEFFLRGVSFKEERPILPGNEVANRTILMSLVALPFRVVCGAPHDHPNLATYRFLGREWPNVWKLDRKDYFEQFEIVGLVLNSVLLVGLLVFCASVGAESVLPLATLLYISNPYFLSQTIFTWPKPLAGFFILLSWASLRRNHGPVAVAVLMALAYHSHPYAIVFAGFIGLFYLSQSWGGRSARNSCIRYGVVFALCVAPWFVWTRLILHIPSDLIAQNVVGAGTEAALASWINFVWIRAQNLVTLLTPMMFGVYPFDLAAVIHRWLFCLPGAVGVILFYPALAQCGRVPSLQAWMWYGLIGPGLALVAVFSCPALPVLHGYQALAGVLLFFGVWWLSERTSRAVFLTLIVVQFALNVFVLVGRGVVVGVRLPP